MIIHPLLFSISCLHKQNEELKLIIEKKDIEIKQYKEEGAILKRSKYTTLFQLRYLVLQLQTKFTISIYMYLH